MDRDTCAAAGCTSRDTEPVQHVSSGEVFRLDTDPFCPEHAALMRQQSIAALMQPLLEADRLAPIQIPATRIGARLALAEAQRRSDGWRYLINYTADIPEVAAKEVAAHAEDWIGRLDQLMNQIATLVPGLPE